MLAASRKYTYVCILIVEVVKVVKVVKVVHTWSACFAFSTLCLSCSKVEGLQNRYAGQSGAAPKASSLLMPKEPGHVPPPPRFNSSADWYEHELSYILRRKGHFFLKKKIRENF